MIGPYCQVNENGGPESLSLKEGVSVYSLISQIILTNSALAVCLYSAPKHLISFHENGVGVISSCENSLPF
jgi:hypothetical protein